MDLIVPQLLAWHLATPEDKRPNDFYSGAVAVLIVIMFAKFVAHNHSSEHIYKSGRLGFLVGRNSHWMCIVAAWLATWLALATLAGWRWFLLKEQAIRLVVFSLLVIAATILLLDIGMKRSIWSTDEEQDKEQDQAVDTLAEQSERQNSAPT
jgi:hypothetical protein